MPSMWDDATAPFTGQTPSSSPDTSSMWGWLSSLFQPGQPFKSGNPALDQMMLARNQPDPQSRAAPPPLGQSLMDLSSLVAPYLVGGAPAGTLSSGMKLPKSLIQATEENPSQEFSGTVYHGSPDTNLTVVRNMPPNRQYDNATSQFGAFFSPTTAGAARYAGDSGSIYETTLNLKNP